MLPPDASVVGIDEHTALAVDLADGEAAVMGAGDVTVLCRASQRAYSQGDRLSLAELGAFAWPEPGAGLPPAVWAEALASWATGGTAQAVPAEVLALVNDRHSAREGHNWAPADELRDRITARGWQERDTLEGPVVDALAAGRSHAAATKGQS